jgi:predicted nuclease of predicted toxin-antitoxin system
VRLLLDMGVSVRVAEALRNDGHDVEHLSELRLNELADKSVFERGTVERRIIVTFDLDFGELAAFATPPLPSVLSLRLDDQTVGTHWNDETAREEVRLAFEAARQAKA